MLVLLVGFALVAAFTQGQQKTGLEAAASFFIASAQAQQPDAWVDPILALKAALEKAESDEGRESTAYITALQNLVQAHLQRGEAMEALHLYQGLMTMVKGALPADDPMVLQARQNLAQFKEAAEACGVSSHERAGSADVDEGLRLVPQFAPFDGRSMAVSQDGRWLANGAGRTLVLKDVESGLVVRQIRNTPGEVAALSFIPGSSHLVVSFRNNCLGVWDVGSGRQLAMANPPLGTGLQDFAVSPDGKLLAARYGGGLNGIQKKLLSVWDIETGRLKRRFFLDETLPQPLEPVSEYSPRIVFTPNSRSLLSYTFLVTRFWNMELGRLAGAWNSSDFLKQAGVESGDKDFLKEIAFSPAGEHMAFRTTESVWLRQIGHQGVPARRLEGSDSAYDGQLRFAPDGQHLLVGTERLYTVDSGNPLSFEDIPGISWGDWVGSDRLLLSYVSGGDYHLVDTDGAREYRSSRRATGLVDVAFANGSELLVTGAFGDSYWDLNSLYRHDQEPAAARFNQPVHAAYAPGRTYAFMSQTADADNRPNTGVYVDTSRHLYTAYEDGGVRVWNLTDDQSRAQDQAPTVIDAHTGAITAIGVSADELYLVSAGTSGSTRVIDFSATEPETITLLVHELPSGKPVWSSQGHTNRITSLAVTPDGQHLVSMSDSRIEIHELATGTLLRSVDSGQDTGRRFGAMAVNGQGQLAFVLQGGWLDLLPRIVLQDIVTGSELQAFENDTSISSLALSADGRLLAATQEGYVRLWSLETGHYLSLAEDYIRLPEAEQTLETIFDPPKEWVAFTPDGYFTAGRGGSGLVALVRGGDAYSLDQFGLRFNRPDILLERLKLGYPGAIEYFRHRYHKRAKQAGLQGLDSAAEVAIPQVDIVEAGAAGADGRLTLRLSFNSPAVDLLSYNIAVNGVPVFGGNGKPLTGRTAEAEASLQLSAGDNLLEVSAISANGMESVRKQLHLKGPEPAGKPTLYFLGFGVSHYADAKLNLGFAHKDVLDLARMFRASGQFGQVHSHAYTDGQVTPQAIREAKALLENTGVDDLVVILVAGHGMHARNAEGTYYYLTHAADPARLPDTAAPFSTLESLLADIPARNRLLLLDTCESGEKEPAFVAGVLDGLQGSSVRARTVRGLTLEEEPETEAAVPRKREYLQQRSRYIFSDLSRRNGIVMFASSAGHEFSYESSEKQNGYFTEALMAVLGEYGQSKNVETLRNKVRKLVVEYSDGKQHPEVYWNNPHANLRFEPIRIFELGSYQGVQ